jgi:hypothetical protein
MSQTSTTDEASQAEQSARDKFEAQLRHAKSERRRGLPCGAKVPGHVKALIGVRRDLCLQPDRGEVKH